MVALASADENQVTRSGGKMTSVEAHNEVMVPMILPACPAQQATDPVIARVSCGGVKGIRASHFPVSKLSKLRQTYPHYQNQGEL